MPGGVPAVVVRVPRPLADDGRLQLAPEPSVRVGRDHARRPGVARRTRGIGVDRPPVVRPVVVAVAARVALLLRRPHLEHDVSPGSLQSIPRRDLEGARASSRGLPGGQIDLPADPDGAGPRGLELNAPAGGGVAGPGRELDVASVSRIGIPGIDQDAAPVVQHHVEAKPRACNDLHVSSVPSVVLISVSPITSPENDFASGLALMLRVSSTGHKVPTVERIAFVQGCRVAGAREHAEQVVVGKGASAEVDQAINAHLRNEFDAVRATLQDAWNDVVRELGKAVGAHAILKRRGVESGAGPLASGEVARGRGRGVEGRVVPLRRANHHGDVASRTVKPVSSGDIEDSGFAKSGLAGVQMNTAGDPLGTGVLGPHVDAARVGRVALPGNHGQVPAVSSMSTPPKDVDAPALVATGVLLRVTCLYGAVSVASRNGDISSVLQGGFPRRQCDASSGSTQGVARRDLDRAAIFVAMVLVGFAIVPAPTPLFVVGAHRQVGEPRLARSQERPLHGADRVAGFELQVAPLCGGRRGRDAQAGGDLHVPSALFMRGRQPRGEADPSSVFPRPLAVTVHIGSVPDAEDDVTPHAADGVAGRDFDLAGVPVAGLAGADAHVPRQARAEASIQVREGVRGVELQAAGAGIPVGRAGVTVGVVVVVGVDPPVGSRVVGVVILVGDREGLVRGVPDARGDLDVASLVGQAATSADGNIATGRFLGVASLEVQETPVVGPVLALVLDEHVLVQLVLVDLLVQLVQSVPSVELDSVVSRQHDALAGVQVDVAVIEPDIFGGAAHPVRFPAPGGDVDVATVPLATETRVELDGAGGEGRVAREDGDVARLLLSLARAEEDPPAHTQVGPVGGLAGGLGVPGVGGGKRDVAGSGEVAAPGKPRNQVDAAPVVVLGGAPGDGDVASVAHAVGAELEEVVIGSVPERRQEGGPVRDPGAVASSEVDLASDPESSPAGFHDDGSSAGGGPPGTLQHVILDGRVSGRK